MIEQIQINDWRQFDNLTIDFDKRLTILTGANGSGKTTILNILSKAFGESVKFVSNVSETADGSIDYTSSVIGDLHCDNVLADSSEICFNCIIRAFFHCFYRSLPLDFRLHSIIIQ